MLKKLLCLLVCACLPVSAALAEDDGVVAEIGTRQITRAELDAAYEAAYGDYAEGDEDLEFELRLELVNRMLQEEAERQMMQQQGFDQFTQEQIDQATEEAKEEYAEYVSYYSALLDDGSMDREELESTAVAYLEAMDMSEQDMIDQAVNDIGYELLREWALQGSALSEEELYAYYEDMVEDDRALYETYPDSFISCALYGIPCLYVPEGMREVRQIVVAFDDDQSEEYGFLIDACAQGVDVQADIDALYAQLDSRVTEIYNQLDSGKSFADVELEYSDDWTALESGLEESVYYVSAETTVWEDAFTEAAMALEAPGAVSDPVQMSDGIHILCYETDLTPGPAEYEDVKDYVADVASYMLESEAYSAAVESWMEELCAQIFLEELEG